MDKRRFLTAATLGVASLPALAQTPTPPSRPRRGAGGPTLLTLTGAIGKSNRGAIDKALDQLMVKQKLSFDKAFTFDHRALMQLPARTIEPTLEYDGKPHKLSGPLLTEVLRAAGVTLQERHRVLLRAIDGYAPGMTAAELQRFQPIIATHIDGQPLPLGGLGPLWAVHDADRIPELAAKPLGDRFALCPWGLYHIEVAQAPA